MLYELRVYTVIPGRIAETIARFGRLNAIFSRHGIDNVGRWYASNGPSGPTWVYLMAYRDFAERDAQWNAFYKDDAWWSLRTETNAGEEMTERYDLLFLRPNGCWEPAAGDRSARIGGIHELTLAEVAVGQTTVAHAYLRELYLPLAVRAGARVMMMTDLVSGTALPKTAWMLAWPDVATQSAGRQAVDFDSDNLAALKAQRVARGRAALGRVDSWLLKPDGNYLPFATLGNPRPGP
jgi:hypothetical protein